MANGQWPMVLGTESSLFQAVARTGSAIGHWQSVIGHSRIFLELVREESG
jgi:hypothetical protein